jgi:hypothetical protein
MFMKPRLPPNTISGDMNMELMQAYVSRMNTGTLRGEYHPASPLVDFITELARTNYQAVLDSGFLDMLLCMYACNFSSGETTSPFTRRLASKIGSDHNTALLEACSALLAILCQHADALVVVSAHPLCVLWPKNRNLLFLFGRRSNERCLQWRELGSVIVAHRLAALPDLLQLPIMDKADFSQLTDVCVDIVEFSRYMVPHLICEYYANQCSEKPSMAQVLPRMRWL